MLRSLESRGYLNLRSITMEVLGYEELLKSSRTCTCCMQICDTMNSETKMYIIIPNMTPQTHIIHLRPHLPRRSLSVIDVSQLSLSVIDLSQRCVGGISKNMSQRMRRRTSKIILKGRSNTMPNKICTGTLTQRYETLRAIYRQNKSQS